jgi:hypothetical protein
MAEAVDLSAAPPSGGAVKRTAIEAHSIDYIGENERHGTVARQAAFWFVPPDRSSTSCRPGP